MVMICDLHAGRSENQMARILNIDNALVRRIHVDQIHYHVPDTTVNIVINPITTPSDSDLIVDNEPMYGRSERLIMRPLRDYKHPQNPSEPWCA